MKIFFLILILASCTTKSPEPSRFPSGEVDLGVTVLQDYSEGSQFVAAERPIGCFDVGEYQKELFKNFRISLSVDKKLGCGQAMVRMTKAKMVIESVEFGYRAHSYDTLFITVHEEQTPLLNPQSVRQTNQIHVLAKILREDLIKMNSFLPREDSSEAKLQRQMRLTYYFLLIGLGAEKNPRSFEEVSMSELQMIYESLISARMTKKDKLSSVAGKKFKCGQSYLQKIKYRSISDEDYAKSRCF